MRPRLECETRSAITAKAVTNTRPVMVDVRAMPRPLNASPPLRHSRCRSRRPPWTPSPWRPQRARGERAAEGRTDRSPIGLPQPAAFPVRVGTSSLRHRSRGGRQAPGPLGRADIPRTMQAPYPPSVIPASCLMSSSVNARERRCTDAPVSPGALLSRLPVGSTCSGDDRACAPKRCCDRGRGGPRTGAGLTDAGGRMTAEARTTATGPEGGTGPIKPGWCSPRSSSSRRSPT